MTLSMTFEDVRINWLQQPDLMDCVWIDGCCFERPHSVESLTDWLRNGNGRHVGIVLKCQSLVQGFALYSLHDRSVHLERLAVAPHARQQGVATILLLRLCSKVAQGRRRCITCQVQERNLPMQRLLRSLCFRCTGMEPDRESPGDDLLNFRYLALKVS